MFLTPAESPGRSSFHSVGCYLDLLSSVTLTNTVGNHSAHILVGRLNEVMRFISEQSALLFIVFLHGPKIDRWVVVQGTKD